MEEKIYISDLTLPEVKAYLAEIGEKPFRAARLKKITRPASSAHRIENFSRRLASRMAQKSTSVKSSMG
jgi:hypothetical protein